MNEVSAAGATLEGEQRKRDSLSGEIRAAETELAELERMAAFAETQQRASEPQIRELARKVAELRSMLGIYEEGLRQAAALSLQADELNAFETKRAEAASAVDAARDRITSLRTALAVTERDVAGARAALAAARTMAAQLESQVTARSNRLETLRRQVRALTEERDTLQARADESARALAELEERVAPADAGLIESEKEQAELEEQESLLRVRLREFEDAHNNAVLDAERARSDVARLATEIEDDLASGRIVSEIKVGEAPAPNGENGELEAAPRDAAVLLDADLPGQLRLRMSDEVVALPVVSAVPEELEKEIRKLRNQVKYMGTINPNAPREHDELKARHAFLTEQAQDAHHAIESLNKAVAELDEIMRRKFEETFKAVNAEFGKFFTLLFNGGTARLELTEPEDLTQTGIDIVAKPPGKRAAHLAMLSGGERSLTAAALLFAILKVSPTPFCVLDEVDAMLDEANVGRFRDALKTLALDTQFIVITHNRATMESASTVFGITMSDDGVSQAMSLRLDRETANSAAA
ncbi:MAG: hypothetical protein M1570_02155 [Chloroflexi bacterium]|nr:hypothetical protein [Chloroflexota bacterium]